MWFYAHHCVFLIVLELIQFTKLAEKYLLLFLAGLVTFRLILDTAYGETQSKYQNNRKECVALKMAVQQEDTTVSEDIKTRYYDTRW